MFVIQHQPILLLTSNTKANKNLKNRIKGI